MQFNSVQYAVLLLGTVIAFYGIRGGARTWLLIGSSLLFYAAWSVPLTSLIIISALVDFFASREMGRTDVVRKRRALLILSLAVNLSLLATFKYANFGIDSVRLLLGYPESETPLFVFLLPPGISFYTFQTMSYSIDVYRGWIQPTQSFPRFLLYVSFFPQLIAGPIERAGRILPQLIRIEERHPINWAGIQSGLELIVWGLFKKVLIADQMGRISDAYFANPSASDGWSATVALYAFVIQVYCDFSAYSEIAKGSARLFGIELMWNFNQPYLAQDISDFWRRWHISLSDWMRDYVYIGLGGSRHGRFRTLSNLFTTMFLSGLWHGASWNFVLWGLVHGVLLLFHTLYARTPFAAAVRRRFGRAWPFMSWFLTFHAFVIAALLFRNDRVENAAIAFKQIVGLTTAGTLPTAPQLGVLGLVALFMFASWLDVRFELMKQIRKDPSISAIFHAALIIITLAIGSAGITQFIYFQF